jgi:hypothetical protein
MTTSRYPNWLHLDLKGAVPTQPRLLQWLKYFASLGYDAILWEYEDRFPWKTWPGVFRGQELGYTRQGWREIWATARELGMQNIPLIQTQGHLEWLLKHDAYVHWREDGHCSEVCPQHPQVLPALKSWIDEVIALHPDSPFICLGGDETWNLATCAICKHKADKHPNGKLSIYLDHVGSLCRHALDRGVTPMIWADMFWREKRTDLVSELPSEVVLIDWQYHGAGPWETTAQLASSGRTLWGASAVRCTYAFSSSTLAPLNDRVNNVTGWREQASQQTVKGLIHTTWGRGRSLLPIYGPWEGWIPGFIAAGHHADWPAHPLRAWIERVDEAIDRGSWLHYRALTEDLQKLLDQHQLNEYETLAVQWWMLSVRFKFWYGAALVETLGYQGWLETVKVMGNDTDWQQQCFRQRARAQTQLDEWERDAREFWQRCQLSDADEFFAGRLAPIRALLQSVGVQQQATRHSASSPI